MLRRVKEKGFARLKLIWADAGYDGQPMRDWVFHLARWVFEVIKRSDSTKGFVVLPRRWVVERTFAWLARYRRLSKNYEQLTQTSEAMIYAAMIRLMPNAFSLKQRCQLQQSLYYEQAAPWLATLLFPEIVGL